MRVISDAATALKMNKETYRLWLQVKQLYIGNATESVHLVLH